MIPITRGEQFLATAAGDADAPATLPEPVTRGEMYLARLCDRIAALTAQTPDISPEDIQTAVTDYLDEHGVTINIRAATDEEFEEAMNNA